LNDLLTILQHADSAFPSGSFAFSNGIEGLAAMNAPLDRSGLRDVVAMFLQHRWVTSDRVAVALAHRAGDDFDKLAEIDQAVEAATLAEPLRNGSKRNGNALLAGMSAWAPKAPRNFVRTSKPATPMAICRSCKASSGARAA
jgi:urease accessory protein